MFTKIGEVGFSRPIFFRGEIIGPEQSTRKKFSGVGLDDCDSIDVL